MSINERIDIAIRKLDTMSPDQLRKLALKLRSAGMLPFGDKGIT